MSGFVYFIAPEAMFCRDEESLQRVKIGFTKSNPVERLKNLGCGSPVPLELIGYVDGPIELERAFHDAFAPLRCQGEWFYADLKLRDFLGYFDDRPRPHDERYIDRDKLLVSLCANVFAECAPNPSISDDDYLASADPSYLAPWFPEVFE